MNKPHRHLDFWPFLIDSSGRILRRLTWREALAEARKRRR